MIVYQVCSVSGGGARHCTCTLEQVRHHGWIFGPNFGMLDIQVATGGRPDIAGEFVFAHGERKSAWCDELVSTGRRKTEFLVPPTHAVAWSGSTVS